MTNSELNQKLNSTIDFLTTELAQVRTGRVTPNLLDIVTVNAYGSALTIKEVATVTVLDAQTLIVAPWDKSLLETISNAIQNSQLKLNPSIKNDNIVVPVPALTQERREEFAKIVAVKLQECKTSIRGVRNDAMKDIEEAFGNKEFGEDEKFSKKEGVDKVIKEFVTKAENLAAQKTTDLSTL